MYEKIGRRPKMEKLNPNVVALSLGVTTRGYIFTFIYNWLGEKF